MPSNHTHEECWLPATYSSDEIEELIVMIRLSKYNHGNPCGAKAILLKLDEGGISPLPSMSKINRILTRQCLTNGRTGYYEADYDTGGGQ